MLKGRYGDTSGGPYLEGRIYLPRLNLQADISFLVDTGADRTTLMPADCVAMGMDYSSLVGDCSIVGVGGDVHVYEEQAVLAFLEDGVAVHTYQVEVIVVPPSPGISEAPSLLGRDVLSRWRTVMEPATGTLEFTVRDADMTYPVAEGGAT